MTGMSVTLLVLRWAISQAILLVVLFVPAGRLDLPALWVFLGICAVLSAAAIATADPDLARERRRPGPGGFDRRRPAVISLLMFGAVVLAAADVGRLHWSDTVPVAVRTLAMAVFAAGMSLSIWSMASNRFFSPVVRIQTDRGHHLVDTGPYRWIRHPGYAGMIAGIPGAPLAIGSWWGLVPGLACALVILRRAMLEDPYLIAHLDGYAAYAREVRWRVLPGVW